MKRASKAEPVDRRSAILAAALACFNQSGIEAASIGDICARSGASIGSVYHHFGNKEGIAIALLAEGLRRNAAQLQLRLQGVRSARQGVRALIASLTEWVAANPDWARFIYTISSSRLGQTRSAELDAVNAYHRAVIDEFFGPHFSAGAFRRVPRECFASLVLGPMHDYARRWLNGQVKGAMTDHVDVFAAAAWAAVGKAG